MNCCTGSVGRNLGMKKIIVIPTQITRKYVTSLGRRYLLTKFKISDLLSSLKDRGLSPRPPV
jgi:hypothetical protein